MFESLFKKNSGNIAGIYNYCDRWCERCRFADRCATFKFGKKLEAMVKEGLEDGEQEEFILKTSFEILPGKNSFFAEEPDDPDEEELEEFKQHQERREERIKGHELNKISRAYCDAIYQIIKNRERTEFLDGIEMDKELAEQMEAGLAPDLFKILSTQHEAILRFSAAVHVKLHRALDDWFDLMDGEGDSEFTRNDMNGTAKLVLVMIDEMVESWMKLKNAPEGFEKEIDKLFDDLLRIRDLTEYQFPEAREFVRMGHDEK
jgi:hypothetical protein